MPKDVQTTSEAPVLLPDLLTLTADGVSAAAAMQARATEGLREALPEDGKVSGVAIEANQTATHGLAWLATYVEALRQMHDWAGRLTADGKFGEAEQLILQITFGEYLWQLYGGLPMGQGEILRPQDIGLTQDDQRLLMTPAVMTLTQSGNTQAARTRLVALMRDHGPMIGASGLDEEFEMIREQFRRFTIDRVEPDAHEWHLKDELIPMEIIEELAELGVFGLTIPEEYGGFGMSKTAMAVVSEELSRGYIGVGSLATRSEIAAELIICGGTEGQKTEWLKMIRSER